jgi:hypothetical protein
MQEEKTSMQMRLRAVQHFRWKARRFKQGTPTITPDTQRTAVRVLSYLCSAPVQFSYFLTAKKAQTEIHLAL